MVTATASRKAELEELGRIMARAPALFEALSQDSDAPLKKRQTS